MARTRYHHGDLRSALLDQALTAVEADGAAALSLRACARTVGVDVAAAYRHFRDRRAVLEAVAGVGFEQLLDGMEGALTSAGDPTDRFRALARAYVDFARQHPRLFELMFGPDGEGARCRDWGGASAFDLVVAALSDLSGDGSEWTAWTAIHGLAHLLVGGLGPDDDAETDALVTQVVEDVLQTQRGRSATAAR
jgi:AcrR family transcriptional regulator